MQAVNTDVKKAKKKRQITELERRRRAGFLFVLPFIIGFLCFYLQPLITSLEFTFQNVQPKVGGGVSNNFVGLDNYFHLSTDEPKFLPTLTDSLKDMAINTPVIIIFSLFIAVIINQKFRGRMIARAIFFMPVVISSGLVMSVLNGDQLMAEVSSDSSGTIFQASGMVQILNGMNLPPDIISIFTGIVGEIFDTLWKCGIQILLFLAALQGVSPQLYEAAKIEGATGWEMFWKVTFPNVTPIILVNVIYTIIDSITDKSNPLISYINDVAYKNLFYSRACVMAWIFFLILLAIIGIIFLFTRRAIVYQNATK